MSEFDRVEYDIEVVVMDLDRRPLDIVAGACRALVGAGKSRMKISATLDRRGPSTAPNSC